MNSGIPNGMEAEMDIILCIMLYSLMWEYDFKGSERTIDDGPNYRWVIIFKYPAGVSQEEGDEWFLHTFVPEVCEAEEVRRF